MEPLTTAAIATATLLLHKATEKTGEKLGEAFSTQLGKLVQLIHKKPLDKMQALLKAGNPEDAKNRSSADFSQAVQELQDEAEKEPELTEVIKAVEATVKADPALLEKVQKVAAAVKADPSLIQNNAKLAEKIGMLVQGGTVNIQNLTF
jgi:hypothetical protein